MITCNLMGGLGNQLFQIFATIAYGIKSKNQFKFSNVTQLGGGSTTIRNTFWATFLSKLHPFLISDTEFPKNITIIKENGFPFNNFPIVSFINKDIMLQGYFQSYKYFQQYYGVICKIIGLDKMKDDLLEKLDITNDYLATCISIHFRIGDYKKIQQYHPLATYEYYESALNHIKNIDSTHFNVLYFCEEVDINDVLVTINKLIEQFPEYKFVRGDNLIEDWEQMLLMSCCHHNIIANSSFSWWSAYFNFHKDKIICYPSVWFGEIANNDTRDLCPIEWTKINV